MNVREARLTNVGETGTTDVSGLLIDYLDLWTSAVTARSTAGRGTSSGKRGKIELTGIKKLRELILELAVRGKLVDQDPDDEPASVLLERIAEEKARLVKEGKIKKSKELPEISEEEMSFEVSSGWTWCRLGEIAEVIRGVTYKKHDAISEPVDGHIALLRANNIQDSINYLDVLYIPRSLAKEDQVIRKSDILIAMSSGSASLVGKAAQASQNIDATFGAFCGLIRAHYKDVENYLGFYTSTPAYRGQAQKAGKGIGINNLNKKSLDMMLVPVPPLQEQYRIVEKVDEMMAICDRLEQQVGDQLEAHDVLVDTLLDALTRSADAIELAENWARIAEHFDILFTTESSIDKLKKTILHLAVMGRLVEQDDGDEPVEALFTKIRSHQQSRYKAKEIQKPKSINVADSLDVKLPLSWEKALLNDLAFVTKLAGFEYTKHLKLKEAGEVPVVRAQNVRPFTLDTTILKYIDLDTSLQLPRSAIDRACLLITFIGAGIGDVCAISVPERWHLAPNVAKVEPFGDINIRFLNIFLCSPPGQEELFKSVKSTAQPSLSMATIREIWLPMPPREEQHRIVQKVDELMALCDQLKARLTEAGETCAHLAEAVVEQAVTP